MAQWDERRALYLGLAAVAWKSILPHRRWHSAATQALPHGISVVIPSREGRQLLERSLPLVEADLQGSAFPSEVIVVDNGSTDGTAGWLRDRHPAVVVDENREPLSFARAANRGAALAQFARLCLLNNDMEIEPGFFTALDSAFADNPELFCASAQIFFPEGVRREETGKTAMRRADRLTIDDYPVYCDEPLEGEDGSPVLYGSGGCSLYDTVRFRELGGFDEVYEPAYVEDLDLGYRAWLRGWPSVYAAGARTLHRHRSTTSRFFSDDELARLLDRNHARFLLRAIESPGLLRGYYAHALSRLRRSDPEALAEFVDLRRVFQNAAPPADPLGPFSDQEILDLTRAVRVFPGRAARGECYLGYCRPRSTPEEARLARCRAVLLVDGPAGEGAYRAARKYALRRYSIQEVINLEGWK